MDNLWINELPQLRGAGKNQITIYSYMVDLYLRGQPIYPSMSYLSKLCDSYDSNIYRSLQSLVERDLIKIIKHGKFGYKNRHVNEYEINEEFLPKEMKINQNTAEDNNTELLKEYIRNLQLSSKEEDKKKVEKLKESLLDWVEVTHTDESVIQLKYKLNELYNFAGGNWDIMQSRINQSIQKGWYNFIFKEDREQMLYKQTHKDEIKDVRI